MFYETSSDKLIFKEVPSDVVAKLAKHANCLFIQYNINGAVFERLVTNLEIRGNAQGKMEVTVSSKPWSLGKKNYFEIHTDLTVVETFWGRFYIDVKFIGKALINE